MNKIGADPDHPSFEAAVVKLGGSVLRNRNDYLGAAGFLDKRLRCCPARRLAVVVSAQYGRTDGLQRLAQELIPRPERRTLDLLWSCGELHSVALMTLCLQRLGVPARGLNVHESGLVLGKGVPLEDGPSLQSGPLLQALGQHPVVVVPGFFACADQSLVSLGRGGSDLTALLLAEGLGLHCCELVKDVPGYFSTDPNQSGNARPLPFLSYRQALEMARQGCDLVQPQALEAAARTGIRLLIRSLNSPQPSTLVGPAGLWAPTSTCPARIASS